jgi:hypothetical protein
MWKAELRRMTVLGQPRQKKFVGPHINRKKSWAWWCICNPSNRGKLKLEDHCSGWTSKKRDPISKITKAKKATAWLKQ